MVTRGHTQRGQDTTVSPTGAFRVAKAAGGPALACRCPAEGLSPTPRPQILIGPGAVLAELVGSLQWPARIAQ